MKSLPIVVVSLMILIKVSLLSSVDYLAENINGTLKLYLLIPYNDLFYQFENEVKSYNNFVAVSFLDENNELQYQEEQQIEFRIDTALAQRLEEFEYSRSYYPLRLTPDLNSDNKYELLVNIQSDAAGSRRSYRREFRFPSGTKKAGTPLFIAALESLLFVIRGENELAHKFDSLTIWQYLAFQPDSTKIVLKADEKETILSSQQYLPDMIPENEDFSVRIHRYFEEREVVAEPVFPNQAFFFQQEYTPQEQLNQLRLVINQADYNKLKSVSSENLQEAINNYWQRIDPDPFVVDNLYRDTFYSRVKYADENFGVRSYVDGWQSDRGRVYLKYGEPDQIVSDVFPVGRDPSIIWRYYNINKEFVFYDLRGYGNYELKDKWLD
jgi:GWxTD domain-containing protein